MSLINTAYIPIGIVEKKVNNYYISDSLFYKVKIYNEDIEIGDVIEYIDAYKISSESDLKKNYIYICNNYNKVSYLSIKNRIHNIIDNSNSVVKKGLNKFLLNINDYNDLNFNLGYGIAIYYLLKLIYRKNKYLCVICLIVYSLLFYFDLKFYLIIIDLILNENKNSIFYEILILSLLNKHLFNNYSILLPLLIRLYRKIYINIDFRLFLAIIESYLFGSINIIYSMFYKYIIYFQILLICLSFFVLLIPSLSNLYELLIVFYENINNINLEIRGSITLFGFFMYFLIVYILKLNNTYLKYSVFILIILTGLNNPFTNITFIDVGQGDSILIRLPFRSGNILIDTGSTYNYYKLRRYLYSKSIYNIDYLIITHNDSDHNGNINNLKSDFNINEIVEYGKDISINNLKLKYLYIDRFDNDNDNSLVYWLKINNISFLLTGDISSQAERKLVREYSIDVDVLKASHHGSKTGNSNALISSILPKICVISTSGQYNHPSLEVINRLNDFLCDVYITNDSGNIEFIFSGIVNIIKTQKGDFAIIK